MLYHLVEKVIWEATLEFKEPYFSISWERDGFIHLTEDPALLLTVANSFFINSKGDWLCLELDPTKLTAEVKYEPAKPDRRNTPIWEEELLFPHLYGELNVDAVVRQLRVHRSPCGRFIAIDGLPQAGTHSVPEEPASNLTLSANFAQLPKNPQIPKDI
eukprot:jgi/Botrbrau1/655/Bobra.0161s0043.1